MKLQLYKLCTNRYTLFHKVESLYYNPCNFMFSFTICWIYLHANKHLVAWVYIWLCRVSLYDDTKMYFIIFKWCHPSLKAVAPNLAMVHLGGISYHPAPDLLTCEAHRHLRCSKVSQPTGPALPQLRQLIDKQRACQDPACHHCPF